MFIAACNPYQLKKIKDSNENDVFFVHPDKSNALTHKVNPINSRMLQCLFDYGALSPKVELKYVEAIFSEFTNKINKTFLKLFIESVVSAQNFIKKEVSENESSVSLRDIKRVKKIFIFYCYLIRYRNDYKHLVNKKGKYFDEFLEIYLMDFSRFPSEELFIAFIVSISINYLYRIIKHGRNLIYSPSAETNYQTKRRRSSRFSTQFSFRTI